MNIADVISRNAKLRPYAAAVVSAQAVIHYRALERSIWVAADKLRRAGVDAGDVVGISLPHGPLYLIAVLALARLGAACTSLSLQEPAAVRLAFAKRFGVKCVVARPDSKLAPLPGLPVLRVSREALSNSRAVISRDHRVEADDLVFTIRRTSGTTGEAKGVALTHRQWLEAERGQDEHFPFPAQDRFLSLIDMATPYGLHQCLRALINGGTVYLTKIPFKPVTLFELIDRHAINRLATTPNLLDDLLPSMPAARCRFPSLRDLTVAGMAIGVPLRNEIRRRISPALKVKYGSNEAGFVACADARLQERFPGTVGPAARGMELQVVGEDDQPLPPDTVGRVRVRAPWLPKGYFNACGTSAQTFKDGWLYLGDLGSLNAEGMLFISGRVDDLIIHGAIKIMPADIEAVLLQHPAVAEAAAFAVPSARQQDLPVAAVVLRQPVSAQELREFCRERLGKRAPAFLRIVKEMPRNAMGKIVKRELARRAAEKLPR